MDNGKNEQSKSNNNKRHKTSQTEVQKEVEKEAEKFFFEQDTCGVLGKYSSFTVKIKFDKYL